MSIWRYGVSSQTFRIERKIKRQICSFVLLCKKHDDPRVQEFNFLPWKWHHCYFVIVQNNLPPHSVWTQIHQHPFTPPVAAPSDIKTHDGSGQPIRAFRALHKARRFYAHSSYSEWPGQSFSFLYLCLNFCFFGIYLWLNLRIFLSFWWIVKGFCMPKPKLVIKKCSSICVFK